MKVILATGIFYPDVGGPAIHVRRIAEALKAVGYAPVVIAYGDSTESNKFTFPIHRISRHSGKVGRWLHYFLKTLKLAAGADVIYAFDISAAGLPAFLAAKLFRKKFVVRIGGDPIWERVVENGARFLSLEDYYEQGLYRVDRPWLYRLIRFILRYTDATVFYNQMFREFYIKYYGLAAEKITVIPNPISARAQTNPQLPAEPTILFAGRFVAYKNLPLVLRVFKRVHERLPQSRLLLIGHGPDRDSLTRQIVEAGADSYITLMDSMPQEKLFKLIAESAIVIGPALSEFNPNSILEALSFGKPVLLSRGHGLTVALPPEFEFDPKNEAELEQKLLWFLNEANYRRAVELVEQLPQSQTWEKVTAAHLDLLKSLVRQL
ncbi:MAG: glycosyltransferase family 4 protein [Candidatus Vogelbacteria bacterium]|nr:glycosyltransferase family 4 protein [Candidatus Vogelbacteria bacterium]